MSFISKHKVTFAKNVLLFNGDCVQVVLRLQSIFLYMYDKLQWYFLLLSFFQVHVWELKKSVFMSPVFKNTYDYLPIYIN